MPRGRLPGSKNRPKDLDYFISKAEQLAKDSGKAIKLEDLTSEVKSDPDNFDEITKDRLELLSIDPPKKEPNIVKSEEPTLEIDQPKVNYSCGSCGARLDDEVEKCSNCGVPLRWI